MKVISRLQVQRYEIFHDIEQTIRANPVGIALYLM